MNNVSFLQFVVAFDLKHDDFTSLIFSIKQLDAIHRLPLQKVNTMMAQYNALTVWQYMGQTFLFLHFLWSLDFIRQFIFNGQYILQFEIPATQIEANNFFLCISAGCCNVLFHLILSSNLYPKEHCTPYTEIAYFGMIGCHIPLQIRCM